MNRRLTSLVLLAIAAPTCWSQKVEFNRDIRPILSDKCYACHGPDEKQRQGGDSEKGGLRFDRKDSAFADLGGYRAIVPGKPQLSEMIKRILSADPDEMMPPPKHPKRITAREKELLKRWVAEGAKWSDHWAYTAPRRHPVPQVKNTSWCNNWIDAFVLSDLERRKIQPSQRAPNHVLIRRLAIDLLGMPPSRRQIDSFLRDGSRRAVESVVTEMLASPHFGERMACYWLDLVRYADTVGYHGDQSMSVSPYRDYVIHAFNRNMSFDRFTREQLAGDLLKNPTTAQLVASGYNRIGMMSAEGGVQPKEYLAKYAADRVRTASSVWLGSTLGCAECHNHKFDPFTSRDFYSFAAFFADIKERGLYSGSKFGPQIEVPSEHLPHLLRPIDARIADLEKRQSQTTPAIRAAQREWETRLAKTKPAWRTLAPKTSVALHGTQLKAQPDGSILASGANPPTNVYTIAGQSKGLTSATGIRIEVMPDKSLPKKGPGRAGNGNFVLSELKVQVTQGGKTTAVDLQNASATIEQTVGGRGNPYKKWSAASAIDKDAKGSTWGWAILPAVGKQQILVAEFKQPVKVAGDTSFTVTLEQKHTNPKHTIGRFRVSLTAAAHPLKASPGQGIPADVRQILAAAADKRTAAQKGRLDAHYRSISPLLAPVRKQLAAAKKQRADLIKRNTRSMLVTVTVKPREMRLLKRGNWMDMSGPVVQPAVPHFLRQIKGKGRNSRLDLATWMTSRDNPLTARVFVNRVWKLLFGQGLSKSLDDVGAQGSLPTHPALLDNLAIEFMESGWDVKHIFRLIASSNTYQQSSMMRADLAEVDPYNTLLARQSRFRMDAEFIRDSALFTSGLLVQEIGGSSVRPYQPPGLYRHLNFPRRTYKASVGKDQYRRGVYTHWQRQFLHPAMKSFDAPSREECTAERPRSNTPLAALVLLNDPSYVEAARAFAERVIRNGGAGDESRLRWMMMETIARYPSKRESQILRELLDQQRATFAKQPDKARAFLATGQRPIPADLPAGELAAWTTITRALFNLHESITRN